MEATEIYVAIAIVVSGVFAGLSGIGFSLIAAPALSMVITGPSSVGLVNLLALVQNIWQVWREKGRIHWDAFRLLGIGLVVGVGIGWAMIRLVPVAAHSAVVAASSLMALGVLLLWRPRMSPGSATLAGAWGAAMGTYASVSGPPLAAYLIRLGWPHSDFIRTLQLVFAVLNLVSLPLLGLPSLAWWEWVGAILLVVVGVSLGHRLRHLMTEQTARRLSIIVIAITAVLALALSLIDLMGR